jgi:inosine-uridine nucleoside N-ribohydrolase
MAIPVLIDTDMGVDDAVALALAAAAEEIDLRAVVSTGGNVDLEQATQNVARFLAVLQPSRRPLVGRGCDQTPPDLRDARHVFGEDGLGECGLPLARDAKAASYRTVYRRFLDEAGESATIVAIGPLTTLAEVLREDAVRMHRVRRIVVMGGALWRPGNIDGKAEFNFYRDPAAAATVMSSGLPITLVPLDVTQSVTLDESNVAHLAASGTPAGEWLAKMIEYPLANSIEAGPGRFVVHDALAVGSLLWPDLFVATGLGVEVERTGPRAGMTRPKICRQPAGRIDVLTAVNAVDFLENMMERLCQEKFVV